MNDLSNSGINVIIQNPDTLNWVKDFILPLSATILGVLVGAILSYYFSLKLFKNQMNLEAANNLFIHIEKYLNFINDYNIDQIINNSEIDVIKDKYYEYGDPLIKLITDLSNVKFLKRKTTNKLLSLVKYIIWISPPQIKLQIDSEPENISNINKEFTIKKDIIIKTLIQLQFETLDYKINLR